MADQRYYRPYGVGVFPLNYTARERTVIEVQAKRDRRHIPPVWFWRLLTPAEQGTGADPDDEYFEQPFLHRQFAKAVAAHLYVNDTTEEKGMKRGKVETAGTVNIEMSRAEVGRLALVYGIVSDVAPDAGEGVYIPQPGDLFMYKGVHFIVHQMTDEDHFGPTGIPAVWRGTASQIKDDATAPIFDARPELVPPTDVPSQPVGEDELSWPG
jgi:hypothetical protein